MKATLAFTLPALCIAAGLLSTSSASAQCPNGAIVCADISASASVTVSGSASVSVSGRRSAQVVTPVPPPPPAQPQGRIIVVQPAPQAPPPQQQIYVAPAPQVQEQVVIIEQEPQRLRLRAVWNQKFGLTARVGGIFARNVQMGGFAAGIRYRPSRIFGVEFSIGAYGGTDYNDQSRIEVPIAFDFRFSFPRESRFQVYMLIGPNISWASTDGYDSTFFGYTTQRYAYMGGHIGMGGEWRIGRRFAMSAELRGFLRTRVDGGATPEFYNEETGQTTNTSAGALLNIGAHLYF